LAIRATAGALRGDRVSSTSVRVHTGYRVDEAQGTELAPADEGAKQISAERSIPLPHR
jgi:hypothetical protein